MGCLYGLPCWIVFCCQVLGCWCCCPYFGVAFSPWNSLGTFRGNLILETTVDKGDNYHWVGANKKPQTIHLTFLGFTEMMQVDKHEIYDLIIVAQYWMQVQWVILSFYYRYYKWKILVNTCAMTHLMTWPIMFNSSDLINTKER